MDTNLMWSLLLGASVFYIVMNYKTEENTLDSKTLKRLNAIKNKVFGIAQESPDEKSPVNKNIKDLIQDTDYKIRSIGNILDKLKVTATIKKLLKIADIKMTVDIFLMMSAGLALPFFLFSILMPDKAMFLLVLGIILGYCPYASVKMKIKKRHDQFTQQFPDALGLISSSLRAGHSLSSSFHMVVQELPEPVSQIFKIVVDDMSLGRDTRDALENMISYMPDSIDLRFFITAVLIQREIGGNLAEILDSLNYTIRERFKLLGQLKAQTAQASMSGIVLALAPGFIALIIWFMNPSYLEPLFKEQIGQIALGSAIGSATLGFMLIKKITNIKV